MGDYVSGLATLLTVSVCSVAGIVVQTTPEYYSCVFSGAGLPYTDSQLLLSSIII